MRLDGFKSYAQPVEINDFDAFFNAINGLNGSGKSNILDGICFVLGQSSCKSFRVDQLQQLIYKNGQAGITKCSVSIVFDNSNPAQSPIGLESQTEFEVTRQIIVGGKNKYLLNGSTKTNTQISDLFKTVSLNINSPHFVIMQGRVTKVMNMKPIEVLGMIEEATGTKMYETKKINAQKLIEKKDRKLAEIKQTIDEELTPTLEKLRSDRVAYIQYQKIEREIEGVERRCLAYQVYSINKKVLKNSEIIQETENMVASVNDEKAKKIDEINVINENVKSLESEKQNQAGDSLSELENLLKEAEKCQQDAELAHKSKQTELNQSRKELKNLEKEKSNTVKSISSKEANLKKTMSGSEDILEAVEKAKSNLEFAEKRFDAVSAGLELSSETQTAQSNAEKLSGLRDTYTEIKTKHDSVKMKTSHAKKVLPGKKKELQKVSSQADKDQKQLTSIENRYQTAMYDMEDFLKKTGYKEGLEDELEQEYEMMVENQKSFQKTINQVKRQLPHLFSEPDLRNLPSGVRIDTDKIFGVLGKLMKVSNVSKFGNAIQSCLGGDIYAWVTADTNTGKILVERKNKCFNRNVKVLPLDKITHKNIDRKKLELARKIAGDKDLVHAAIDLVEYEPFLEPVMKHTLKDTLITANVDISNKVAFHKDIKLKCISLDGDVTSPTGTISGGSAPKNQVRIFEILSDLAAKEFNPDTARDIQKRLESFRRDAANFQVYTKELETAKNNLEMTKQRLANSSAHRLLQEVKDLEADLNSAETEQDKFADQMKKANEEIKKLENEIKNETKNREEKLKKAKADVQKCIKELKSAESKASGTTQAVEELKAEIESLKAELEECLVKVTNAEKEAEIIEAEMLELKSDVNEKKSATSEAKNHLEARKDILKNVSMEISKLLAQIKNCEDVLANNDRTIKDAEYKIKEMNDSNKKLEKDRHNSGVSF